MLHRRPEYQEQSSLSGLAKEAAAAAVERRTKTNPQPSATPNRIPHTRAARGAEPHTPMRITHAHADHTRPCGSRIG